MNTFTVRVQDIVHCSGKDFFEKGCELRDHRHALIIVTCTERYEYTCVINATSRSRLYKISKIALDKTTFDIHPAKQLSYLVKNNTFHTQQ